MPLFLVATPIGNLQDISQRALDCLQTSDLILCEDTRTSIVLLRHYAIEKPLLSFHKFNETAKQALILEKLQAGQSIALISDAGTPCICDPGQQLVASCRSLEILVIPLPGPSSILAALSASGLPSDRFQFLGFSPKTISQKRRFIEEALTYKGTSLFFESPERVQPMLTLLWELAPTRKLALAKELSKKFETFFLGQASELYEKLVVHLSAQGEGAALLKGEWVFLLSQEEPACSAISLDLQHMAKKARELEAKGLSRRDSLIALHHLLGVPSQALYKLLAASNAD